MTSVQEHVDSFRNGSVNLNTPLTQLLYIGPYIGGRLAAHRPPLLTVGDWARFAQRHSAIQIHNTLSELTRNRRANECIRDTGRGVARNGVTDQYHVRDVNLKGYNTLRNLLVAVRRHWAVFRRIPQRLRVEHPQRDAGAAICSCVTQAAQCQQLEQQGDCVWRNNRCTPRPRSAAVAFPGVAGMAGQHRSQGPPPPQSRFERRFRIPENR